MRSHFWATVQDLVGVVLRQGLLWNGKMASSGPESLPYYVPRLGMVSINAMDFGLCRGLVRG